MNVAIIGCGSIGARHARNLKALGHEPQLADSDPSRALALAVNLARAGGGHSVNYVAVEDIWRLPQKDVKRWPWPDAVMICTPADTHSGVALQLSFGGYRGALFVEKPLAVPEYDYAVFREWPHPTTMVGYMLRHHEKAAAIRAVVPAPNWISCRIDCDVATWPGHEYAAFIYEASHEIDLALWFGGEPTIVSAELGPYSARLRGPNWDVAMNGRSPRYHREWSASGAMLGYQHAASSPEELGTSMYISELAHFLDCAARGMPTMTPFADGLRVLDVIQQAQTLAAVPA